jgi:hypothetical protein
MYYVHNDCGNASNERVFRKVIVILSDIKAREALLPMREDL